MVKKILHKLLRHRHPWREIGFDELSEIYINSLFRSLSISLVGIFVPLFLLRLGYQPYQIMIVYACYFSARVAFDYIAAFFVARIGPKHTLVISQIMQIGVSVLFMTLPSINWPLSFIGLCWGAASSMFFIAFDVDFSKIKHRKHAGKEIGFQQAMERAGAVMGPLIGGSVAAVFGARYIFFVSVLSMVIGMWFLLRTREPTRLHQVLDYKLFSCKGMVRSHIVPCIGLGVENTLSICLWPLFLALFVLPAGKEAFSSLGALASLSVVVSIIAAIAVGRLSDRRQGRRVLRVSAVLNAMLHVFRPFVGNVGLAAATNVANEAVTVGYRLPFMKGFYDSADDYPGYRIVYISVVESVSSVAKAAVWWLMVILAYTIPVRAALAAGFVCAAIASLVLATERFRALD